MIPLEEEEEMEKAEDEKEEVMIEVEDEEEPSSASAKGNEGDDEVEEDESMGLTIVDQIMQAGDYGRQEVIDALRLNPDNPDAVRVVLALQMAETAAFQAQMRKEKEKGDLLTLPALLVQKHKY